MSETGVVSCAFPGKPWGIFRVGGPGLANLLWFWCKQVVFSHETGCAKIWPQWNQFKPRSFLRGEINMAGYFGYFKKPQSGYDPDKGWRKLPRQMLPPVFSKDFSAYQGASGAAHWIVGELGNPFVSLFEYRQLIREEWRRILRVPFISTETEPYAAIHLRRGDFRIAGLATDLTETRTFIDRFIDENQGIRKILLTDADRNDRDFWECVPDDLQIYPAQNALQDLQTMIHANVLYGTAESSYSRCGAFLGGMPVTWIGPQELVHELNQLPFMERT